MITSGRIARLPLIDSLRAIAALLIFAYHALFVTGNLSSTNYGYYLSVGVPLFYAISGLLLFRPFARSIVAGGDPPNIRQYARHRVFRIVPAYWFALPIVALVLGRASDVFTVKGIFVYFGFLQAYSLSTFVGGIGQAWTLCVEVTFYAFLPLWVWLIGRAAKRWGTSAEGRARVLLVLLGALTACSIAWKLVVVAHYGGDRAGAIIPLTALPAALDQFAVGMAIAVLVVCREEGIGPSRLLGACSRAPLVPIAGAVSAYFLIGAVHGVSPFDGLGWSGTSWGVGTVAEHELRALVAGGLLLGGVAARAGIGAAGRLLASKPLRSIGEVSYGLYLWHLAVLTVIVGNLHWVLGDHGLLADPGSAGVTGDGWLVLLGVAVSLAISLGVATASWSVIERPLISRSHRSPKP